MIESTTANKSRTTGCEVFVRFRPLVEQELERGDTSVVYSQKFGTKSNTWRLKIENHDMKNDSNFNFGGKKKPQLRARGGFSSIGFKGIINAGEDNVQTYEKAIQPLVNECVLEGHTASCFAYGMTGSGKTHTMMGYGEERGMYMLGAQELLAAIDEFETNTAENDIGFHLSVRFAEIYNGHLYNLLNERKRSQILESLKGEVMLRETEATEDGRFLCGDIRGAVCKTLEDVENAITEGLSLRKSGNSTTHAQSSRSHAVIEMEITTDELARLKKEYSRLDAEITWLNKYAKYEPGSRKKEQKLERQMRKNLELQNAEKLKHSSIGGTMVFCDLAGSEIGSDVICVGDELISTGYSAKQTESEKLEAKKINISLMSLADVLKNQSLDKKRRRIGYRGSSLTMFLRKYLEGDVCRTVMMAAVSPSTAYKKRTVQTLRYAKLLAEIQKKKNKRVGGRKVAALKKKRTEETNSPISSSGEESSDEKSTSESMGEN